MSSPIGGINSARLKLSVASEHIEAIRDEARTFSSREPFVLDTRADGTETFEIQSEPPAEVAVLAGEAVYQIRSSLDHLAFELVKSNPSGASLPNNWQEHCLFPLKLQLPPGISRPPLDERHFTRQLPGISREAFAFIESLQPYYRRGPAWDMWLLAQLSNIDKHRHLNLTVGRGKGHQRVDLSGGGFRESVEVLNHGAELERIIGSDPASDVVRVRRSFSLYISFDESALGGAGSAPVESILEGCLRVVEGIVLPKFEELLKKR